MKTILGHLSRMGLLPLAVAATLASGAPQPDPDLTTLSLEELMNIRVTSVSKKSEKLSQAPAAIYVITGEDIQRSGATSVPEALRLAPGLEVARQDSHNWAISARGFNASFANKLLVLQDGRSIYTPLFSGVFWDQHDVLLEDLDRIEVIRGPQAALWGANAVNGVINIITKSAKDTQGMLLSAGGGSGEVGFGGLRYGAKLGDKAWYRVWAKYFDRDDSLLPNGAQANDAWQMARGGMRVDWEPDDSSKLMFSGDLFGGDLYQTYLTVLPTGVPVAVPSRNGLAGGNLLGRWTRTLSADSELELQAYYDRSDRSTAVFAEHRDNGDISLQHRFTVGERHELAWGLGFRATDDEMGNTFTVSHTPGRRTIDLFTGFLRDKIMLEEDRWWLLLGTHLEHNDFTGVEVQPTARILWTPNERHTIWLGASRAVRTPSRAEDNITINQPGPGPGVISRLMGNTGLEAEELWSGELGWRMEPLANVSFDISLFYQNYDRLRSIEPAGIVPGAPTVVNFVVGNGIEGESYGIELAPRWQVTDHWRLQGSYSFLQLDLRNHPGSADTLTAKEEGNSPAHQFALQSTVDLPHNVSFDSTWRYTDSLPNLSIPGYLELDARLAWRPRPNLELSIVGQNLLDNQHPEFVGSVIRTTATELQRGVYGKVTWRF